MLKLRNIFTKKQRKLDPVIEHLFDMADKSFHDYDILERVVLGDGKWDDIYELCGPDMAEIAADLGEIFAYRGKHPAEKLSLEELKNSNLPPREKYVLIMRKEEQAKEQAKREQERKAAEELYRRTHPNGMVPMPSIFAARALKQHTA